VGVADGYIDANVRRPDTVACLLPVGGTQWGDRPSWLRTRSKSTAASCVATAGPNGGDDGDPAIDGPQAVLAGRQPRGEKSMGKVESCASSVARELRKVKLSSGDPVLLPLARGLVSPAKTH
jgi:hypothetical protein